MDAEKLVQVVALCGLFAAALLLYWIMLPERSASPRKKSGITTGILLTAVVFSVAGVFLGVAFTQDGIADRCDRYGIMYAGTLAYDCKRREVK